MLLQVYSVKVNGAKNPRLLLQPKLAQQRTVRALIGLLQIDQVLATVRDEPQKTAARVLVFAIFVEVGGKLLDATRNDRHLHLRRTGVGVMARAFCDLISLFSLGQHGRNRITFVALLQDPEPIQPARGHR